MTKPHRVRIAGTGSYAPEKILTNLDLEKMVDTNDDWITQRCGIKERHIAAEDEYTSDLAVQAARKALDTAGVAPEEIDLIYFATCTPDRNVPSASCLFQKKIGCFKAGTCDIVAACAGFIYALNMGWHAVSLGHSKRALIVGAETLSRVTDYKDRTTCILFGDAAGAVVLMPEEKEESDILYGRVGSDGRYADLIEIPLSGTGIRPTPEGLEAGMQFIKMKGREVFKVAVPKFVEIISEAAKKSNLTLDEIDLIIPHQMNARMMQAIAERLDIPFEKFFLNLDKYGNTSAASIPLALDEAVHTGRLQRGQHVLLTGMGAGLAWGTIIIRF